MSSDRINLLARTHKNFVNKNDKYVQQHEDIQEVHLQSCEVRVDHEKLITKHIDTLTGKKVTRKKRRRRSQRSYSSMHDKKNSTMIDAYEQLPPNRPYTATSMNVKTNLRPKNFLVRVFRNGDSSLFAYCASCTMNLILSEATRKLQLIRPARRLFDEKGREIFRSEDIRRDNDYYVSCGENYMPVSKALQFHILCRKSIRWTLNGIAFRPRKRSQSIYQECSTSTIDTSTSSDDSDPSSKTLEKPPHPEMKRDPKPRKERLLKSASTQTKWEIKDKKSSTMHTQTDEKSDIKLRTINTQTDEIPKISLVDVDIQTDTISKISHTSVFIQTDEIPRVSLTNADIQTDEVPRISLTNTYIQTDEVQRLRHTNAYIQTDEVPRISLTNADIQTDEVPRSSFNEIKQSAAELKTESTQTDVKFIYESFGQNVHRGTQTHQNFVTKVDINRDNNATQSSRNTSPRVVPSGPIYFRPTRTTNFRVKVYRNGDYRQFAFCKSCSMEIILSAATDKLQMARPARRLFNADGVEIFDSYNIRRDQEYFASPGENFQSPFN